MIPENGFSFGSGKLKTGEYTKVPKFLEYVPVFSISFLNNTDGISGYSTAKNTLKGTSKEVLKAHKKIELEGLAASDIPQRESNRFYIRWNSLNRASIGSNSLCKNIFHITTTLEYYARTGLLQGSGFLATTETSQGYFYLSNLIPRDFLYMFVIKSEYIIEACYRAEGELTFDSNMFEFWVHPDFLGNKYARLRTKMRSNFEKLAEYGINIVFTTDFLKAFAPKIDVPKDLDEIKEYKKTITKPILAKVIEEYGTHTITHANGVYEPPEREEALF